MSGASTRSVRTRQACGVFGVLGFMLGPRCLPAALAQEVQPQRDVHVSVDSRVELLSIIFRLAGCDEYRMGRVAGYVADVDRYFQPYRDDPVIDLARRLRATNSIGYDACMSIAVHLSADNGFDVRRPWKDNDPSLERRWETASAGEFAVRAVAFAKRSNFEGFLADHEPLFARSVSRMNDALAREAHLEWFEAFYGTRPRAAFHLVLGMLNGPANYGVRFEGADGTEELYCIFGVEETDDDGIPVFRSRISATVAHEFSHSFVNHVVEAVRPAFRSAGETLFAAFEDEMRRLAYGNWKTMLDESLVRAATIRYLETYSGPASAQKQLTWEMEDNSFFWLGDLVELLGEYERNRGTYATFDAFMPRVIAFFNERSPEYVNRINERRKKYAALRPNVVATEPVNGAHDVDPGTDRIVISFDRPMSASGYSIMYVDPDGKEHFPELTGQPRYDANGKQLTLPVRLKADWTYRFALNHEGGGAIKSRDGIPLARYVVTFSTAEAE